jgi:hypothetical protein
MDFIKEYCLVFIAQCLLWDVRIYVCTTAGYEQFLSTGLCVSSLYFIFSFCTVTHQNELYFVRKYNIYYHNIGLYDVKGGLTLILILHIFFYMLLTLPCAVFISITCI